MSAPTFGRLDRAGIDDVLGRNRVGRLAFQDERGVDIEPLHYVYDGAYLVARTAPGTKLSALAREHRVAFEVDEWDGLFDWRSVVVRGPLLRVPAGGADWHAAVERLRELVPDAFGPTDPTPARSVIVRIPTGRATGRFADSAGA